MSEQSNEGIDQVRVRADVARATTKSTEISFHLPEALVQQARAAYLTERRSTPTSPRSMAAWVSEALIMFSELSPQGRQAEADAAPTYDTSDKRARPYRLRDEAVTAMDRARGADIAQGTNWNRTSFCTAALRVAI